MRVLSGLLLVACITLGTALTALFVVMLRPSLLHLIKFQSEKSTPESEPYAGVGRRERIKRPAFLTGIQD
ncbi:ABC-type nickel/cobalt efflux system permease component RcnA [Edaphobacter lichenicola]|uniref:ABC-type nickel/cobalt efflux system permease component RcnA n=1 Tax=Tunturiibacter lichenicola TaxID=2051959 RepID=A0A7W8JAM3_9BACT|nr:ABC-type nickel/cobalt efflux system permease component RcnA [Edaphobacter lichenicola]